MSGRCRPPAVWACRVSARATAVRNRSRWASAKSAIVSALEIDRPSPGHLLDRIGPARGLQDGRAGRVGDEKLLS